MADQSLVPQDGGFWVGLAAFATAIGAVFKRRGLSRDQVVKIAEDAAFDAAHAAKTKAQEAVAKVGALEGRLEGQLDGLHRRLDGIETGQRDLTTRIDRLLLERRA